MNKILVINGPNLNMLGKREANVYGDFTLEELQRYTESKLSSEGLSCKVDWFQSNSESEIIDKIHSIVDSEYDALVINPAAYSHTSVAILDALNILDLPVVETHISNTHRRELFRQVKLTAKASTIIMEGLGKDAYYFAILTQCK